MKKKISILGSTGSIGLSALNIINKKKKFFKINYLSANKNFDLICDQIKRYKPNNFIVSDIKIFKKVSQKFKNHKIKILNSFDFKKLAKSDITIAAIPGIVGLEPKNFAIKNEENFGSKERVTYMWLEFIE